MVLKPEPIITCIEAILEKTAGESYHLVYLTPQGVTFSQQKAQELTSYDHLILLCGHYKGIDERVIDYFIPDEISIGNYVLSSGEIAGLVIIDSVVRLIPGVLNDLDSATTDSFQSQWLDAPHYTRPEVFRGMTVPAVLLSGDHAKIKEWRKSKAIERTLRKQQLESRVKATEQV
jgi:tRNA (guanine37-N1)-methyltransferase